MRRARQQRSITTARQQPNSPGMSQGVLGDSEWPPVGLRAGLDAEPGAVPPRPFSIALHWHYLGSRGTSWTRVKAPCSVAPALAHLRPCQIRKPAGGVTVLNSIRTALPGAEPQVKSLAEMDPQTRADVEMLAARGAADRFEPPPHCLPTTLSPSLHCPFTDFHCPFTAFHCLSMSFQRPVTVCNCFPLSFQRLLLRVRCRYRFKPPCSNSTGTLKSVVYTPALA